MSTGTSSEHITVYHGTLTIHVDSIKMGIRQNIGNGGDFHRFELPGAFYTTKQKRSAELWSESLITSVPTNKREGKVIKFKLNLHDLKVYDFGTEKEGAKYELWKKVKSAYIYYL